MLVLRRQRNRTGKSDIDISNCRHWSRGRQAACRNRKSAATPWRRAGRWARVEGRFMRT